MRHTQRDNRRWMMEIIYKAWRESEDNEFMGELYALSDGYGDAGYIPEQGYDWSGIRDSSDQAVCAMYQFCISNMTFQEANHAS